jgi:uncharacterized protein (TIGR03382 family)
VNDNGDDGQGCGCAGPGLPAASPSFLLGLALLSRRRPRSSPGPAQATRTSDPHSTAEMPLVGSAGEIFQIYEGTSQIQRVIIARELFDRG